MTFFASSARSSRERLFQTLALQRAGISLVEASVIAAMEPFVFRRAEGISIWLDTANTVAARRGTMRATRAITPEGDLLWTVFTEGKLTAFHSDRVDPMAAIEEARDAAAGRRAIRTQWRDVEALASDLRQGRERLTIQLKDVYASPFSNVRIDAFRAATGLSGMRKLSGRMAAWLMLIEPQIGFVIHAAWERVHGPISARARQVATPINSMEAPY